MTYFITIIFFFGFHRTHLTSLQMCLPIAHNMFITSKMTILLLGVTKQQSINRNLMPQRSRVNAIRWWLYSVLFPLIVFLFSLMEL